MSLAPTTESRLALAAATSGTACGELLAGMGGLVCTMISRVALGQYSPEVMEDLKAEGQVALWTAAGAWDGTGRFATFAGRRITRAVVSCLRLQRGGTEWAARRQQQGRRVRTDLSARELVDPEPWEVDYVSRASGLGDPGISFVALEEVPEDDLGVPPEVEDGAEARFMGRWLSLPPASRALVDAAEMLGIRSGGVSLTQLAAVMQDGRTQVEERLGQALAALVADSLEGGPHDDAHGGQGGCRDGRPSSITADLRPSVS